MNIYGRIASGTLAFLISSVIAVSAYDVWTTGSNSSGQLGLGDNTDRSVFTRVPRRHDALEVACGSAHMLVRDAEGRLFVCGDNANGQLGIYAPTDQSTPVLLPLPSDGTPRQISAGSTHTIVTRLASICVCGDNTYGQLSTGDTSPQPSILGLLIPGFSCKDIALGYFHSLFLMTDGKVRACGLNGSGQLGQGDTTSRSSATEIPTLSDIIHVAAGGHFSIALNAYGRPYVWGSNSHGQLGLSAGTTTRT
ncbi:MAG: cell wall anchor protein, partial [Spartobacteria bacterium]|nr:cell wall anchor protein [Spartobacteria bacterium]